jgi:hypothetical protein
LSECLGQTQLAYRYLAQYWLQKLSELNMTRQQEVIEKPEQRRISFLQDLWSPQLDRRSIDLQNSTSG